jgi:uncharacterized membrane protein YkoI
LELEMNDKLRGGLIAAAAVAALAGGTAIAVASGGGGSSDSSSPAAQSAESQAADESGARDEAGGHDESAGADDGNGQPVTGSPLARASQIALQRTGGGQVTGSEIRDEEGYYEIEVTKDDGSQVDVHLDQNYNVIDASSDGGG